MNADLGMHIKHNPPYEIHYTIASPTQTQPPKRLEITLELPNGSLVIKEGGNFSIDIMRAPVPKKSDAMLDYLENEVNGVPAEKGVYFGNQNQSPEDRDAAMRTISGLKVFGVDEKQKTIISGIEPIGPGMDATLKMLQKFLALPKEARPCFIGFDIDDTVLGLRPDRTKEELLKDRRGIAEAMALLALEGTRLAFFSDNDSQTTLKRIGLPLTKILQEKGIIHPILMTFYVSGMATKFKMEALPQGEPKVIYDSNYGSESRLKAENVTELAMIVGDVKENEDGIVSATGIVGEYYTQKLTRLNSQGLFERNTEFYPDFLTHFTAKGNVAPPFVQFRDFNPEKNDATMFTIGGLPSQYRGEMIRNIAEQILKRL